MEVCVARVRGRPKSPQNIVSTRIRRSGLSGAPRACFHGSLRTATGHVVKRRRRSAHCEQHLRSRPDRSVRGLASVRLHLFTCPLGPHYRKDNDPGVRRRRRRQVICHGSVRTRAHDRRLEGAEPRRRSRLVAWPLRRSSVRAPRTSRAAAIGVKHQPVAGPLMPCSGPEDRSAA
jgi:hypothetical protein